MLHGIKYWLIACVPGQFRRALETHLLGHRLLQRRGTVFFVRCVLIDLLTCLLTYSMVTDAISHDEGSNNQYLMQCNKKVDYAMNNTIKRHSQIERTESAI